MLRIASANGRRQIFSGSTSWVRSTGIVHDFNVEEREVENYDHAALSNAHNRISYVPISASTAYSALSKRNFSSTTGGGTEKNFTDSSRVEGQESLDAVLNRLAEEDTPVSPSSVADSVTDATLQAADATAELSWYNPADGMANLLYQAHEFAGPEVPYAAVIFGATMLIRTAFLPLAVIAQKNSSRMAHIKPEMDLMKERMEKIEAEGRMTQEMRLRMANEMKGLFARYECNPLKSFLLPIVQFPTFMSMFFALQKLPNLFPDDMTNGGYLWFTDLTASDPYLILPLISAGTFVVMIETTKGQLTASNPGQAKLMINVFRALGIVMVPLTMNFPTSVFCYWVTNNTFSLAQTLMFKMDGFKKRFGIWDPPKPVPGAPEPKGMMEQMKEAFQKSNEQAKIKAAAAAKQKTDYSIPPRDPSRRIGSKKERRNRAKHRD
uniref:Membrane insertase YidC/Oxa/ALB C-terminal domain-containing protein n=1 Tax=Leptocylindrus danicus TaxID=163516 RepID=A0A7S2PFH8_9STRA|mmetsp:Transcript_3105/g.4517  ORF Transcript_3105/g.4517 Transcript_3105/m.4517 type:complete len:437 (+) Transcript_3105:94-1404(+)|eukprot:CAMPEP_0116022748 /NCGR_PEP_ID=MMETSP0321-20121206/11167_1 /TAXON_ID=163516 /ORGANISM="Leptocylindrus danicus var. danicus, Strain B650" /LENGTH=436 /DNA_ID=CAMNT_0003493869 /DNA_START=9 /DNA_END=1319 /DNA_ORIENTATION=+